MIKRFIARIEAWLVRIIHAELVRLHLASLEHTSAIASLERAIQQNVEAQTAELKKHFEAVAEKLRNDLSLDAKTIAEFQHSIRMSCSICGRYGWKYTTDKETGTIKCATCVAKGK